MIYLLQYHGIVPYIVFDGQDLPAKRAEADKRANRRKEAHDKVMERGPSDARLLACAARSLSVLLISGAIF